MKLEKVKSVLSNILESKEEKSLANPVEPIETKVDVVDAETAEEDTEKINKEVNKRIKDIEKNALAVKGEDHVEEPKLVKESKEFKKEERKELGAFIHELKEKKIKHIVKRSVNEGYRYLVEYLNPIKEEAKGKDALKKERDDLWAKMPDCTEAEIQRLIDIRKELGDDDFYTESLTAEKLEEAERAERKYIKTRNSCVDAADLADELEVQGIKYEFEDDGISVASNDYERAMNILYDLEANCDESLKEELTSFVVELVNKENGEDSPVVREIKAKDEANAKELFIKEVTNMVEKEFLKDPSYIIKVSKGTLRESKDPIDLEALRFYVKNWSEGDNITVTADLLNVLEQALDMAEKHGLEESKLNELDLEDRKTNQIEIKPEKKDASQEEDKTEIVIKKEEEPVDEVLSKDDFIKKHPQLTKSQNPDDYVGELADAVEEYIDNLDDLENKQFKLDLTSLTLKKFPYLDGSFNDKKNLFNKVVEELSKRYDYLDFKLSPYPRAIILLITLKQLQEEPIEEGAEGKKEPGKEFVVFDASVDGKAPILGIRSTRVEAEWLMNRLMKTGKYENVSFDEAPKGKFHRGDDFWGPFDESLKEATKKDDGTCPHCHSSNIDFVDSDEDSTKYICRDCGEDFIVLDDDSVTTRNGRPIEEEIDTSKEVWEGWTVQDFIDELEPSFEQIMRGESWVKPFASKDELKKWCMSEQPYYKKHIPEVVTYFDAKVKEFGGYGKQASAGLFDSLKEEEEKPTVNYGDKAWLLNEILASFNNEGAYYSTGWLYIWPDGCSKEDCDYYFGTEEEYKDLEDSFKRIYKKSNYRKDGFYRKPSEEALKLAHEFDTELGLPAMEILGESLEEDINIKINKDNIEITEPTGEGEETVAVIETPKAGEESEVASEEEQPKEGAPEESEEEIKEPVEEELGKETIYIKYWEDEELRDQGISEVYLDKFESVEDAKEVARKLIDRDGFASVEVFISPKGEIESADDKLVWGYDGTDTWTESLEKTAKAVITNEEFESIDEDDVSWVTSTDMSALKEAKVDEPEVTETTTKKVVNFEDVEEDDVSWLK